MNCAGLLVPISRKASRKVNLKVRRKVKVKVKVKVNRKKAHLARQAPLPRHGPRFSIFWAATVFMT